MTCPAQAVTLPPRHLGWQEFSASLEGLDLECRGGDRTAFRSRVEDSNFGDLAIRNVGSRGAALHGERSPARISSHEEELVWVCLVLVGDMRITQQRETAHLAAGDFAIVDAVRPYLIDVPAANTDTLWIGAPRALAARHIWDMDEILARRIDGAAGAGMVASRVLRSAFAESDGLSGDQANRIARGLMDVLAAAADGCRLRDAGSQYRNAIVRRIKNYIDAHIDDDTLTVGRIAGEQGLSTRYLAKIFEGEEQTVSGWIWQRRLELCHAALLAADGARTISDIAYAHGFKNVSHFSRVFRDRYAASPRAVYRSAALNR